jgi:hypothetical protein
MSHLLDPPKKFMTDENRTFDLVNWYIKDGQLSDVSAALLYLRNHLALLKYEFDSTTEKVTQIILSPNYTTVLPKSLNVCCANLRILHEFFKDRFADKAVTVTLSGRCNDMTLDDARRTLTQYSGGYKSRRKNRKPARKTRRAHGRGRGRRTK